MKIKFLTIVLILVNLLSADSFADYRTRAIEGKAAFKSGAVAWSMDNRIVSYIEAGRVVIYDIDKNISTKTGDLGEITGLVWTASGLFCLSKIDGAYNVIRIDPVSLVTQISPVDVSDAVLFSASVDDKVLYIGSQKSTVEKIGIDVLYELYEYTIGTAKVAKTFRRSKIIFGRGKNPKHVRGWSTAGASPSETSLILIEYTKPPALAQYMRLTLIDGSTGKERSLGNDDSMSSSVAGSWSPSGGRMAFASDSGLRIINLKGEQTSIETKTKGGVPAWNPAGNMIYFGGNIIIPNSGSISGEERILEDASDSMGFWSRDGRSIIVLKADGSMTIIEGFNPLIVANDRPISQQTKAKIIRLRELLAGGLITQDEYAERRGRLIEGPEGK